MDKSMTISSCEIKSETIMSDTRLERPLLLSVHINPTLVTQGRNVTVTPTGTRLCSV